MSFAAWLLMTAGYVANAPQTVFVGVPVRHPLDGLVGVYALISTRDYVPVGVDITTPVSGMAMIWRDEPGPRPGPRGPNGEALPPRAAPPLPE